MRDEPSEQIAVQVEGVDEAMGLTRLYFVLFSVLKHNSPSAEADGLLCQIGKT